MSVVQRRYERRPPPQKFRDDEASLESGTDPDETVLGLCFVSLGARWVGPVATVPGGD